MSLFTAGRNKYQPRYPQCLNQIMTTEVDKIQPLEPEVCEHERESLRQLFPFTYGQSLLQIKQGSKKSFAPHKLAVVLSGGQAPGGHNVITGIFDALSDSQSGHEILGILGGPKGLLDDMVMPITSDLIARYRNTGGFDLLGTGRFKIDQLEQFAQCQKVLEKHQCQSLVVIGGDDSNTNAAMLAEYFRAKGSYISVIGVPKTIDGDLQNRYIEASFGFDTAVKLYSELISNLARDTLSSKKYYHFIRLMGREASHITLDAAIQTQPNIVLISEEVAENRWTLAQVVEYICDIIVRRSEQGKNFGVALIPEGLIEFIPEVGQLIAEVNNILLVHQSVMSNFEVYEQIAFVQKLLSNSTKELFASFPHMIQMELLLDRDPHGNVQVSRIETELLLIRLIEQRLKQMTAENKYRGKFSWQRHFLGYEGRCAAPTNFDADYAYSLGRNAAALALHNISGYMSVIRNLTNNRQEWQAFGLPLTSMLNLETRKGKLKPVIKKSLVALSSKPFQYLVAQRAAWSLTEQYRFAGAIQYFGPGELTDDIPAYLKISQGQKII